MSKSGVKMVKHQALRIFNWICWPVFVRRFQKAVSVGQMPSDNLLARLVYHWGNAGWSADTRYLKQLLQETLFTRNRTILELGSGLTTVLLGIVADRQSHRIFSLEHHPGWRQAVNRKLTKSKINGARVFYCPLHDYGSFDWYDLSSSGFPEDAIFDLVICDGPPSQTRGGRSGLPYVMSARFKAGCMIIADDAHRPGEQRVFEQWARDFTMHTDDGRSEAHFRTFLFEAPP